VDQRPGCPPVGHLRGGGTGRGDHPAGEKTLSAALSRATGGAVHVVFGTSRRRWGREDFSGAGAVAAECAAPCCWTRRTGCRSADRPLCALADPSASRGLVGEVGPERWWERAAVHRRPRWWAAYWGGNRRGGLPAALPTAPGDGQPHELVSYRVPGGRAVTVDQLTVDPIPVLARLRSDEPVSWLPRWRWLSPTTWAPAGPCRGDADARTFTWTIRSSPTAVVVGPSMLSVDGPEHGRQRDPFAKGFRPSRSPSGSGGFVEESGAAGCRACGRRQGGAAPELAGPLSVAVVDGTGTDRADTRTCSPGTTRSCPQWPDLRRTPPADAGASAFASSVPGSRPPSARRPVAVDRRGHPARPAVVVSTPRV